LKQHENTVLQLVKKQEQKRTNDEWQQKKIDELEQTNNELQQRIKNLEQQKKTAEQVKDLDLLSQTNNELQKRISDLERDKKVVMDQIMQLNVVFALSQLYADTYTNWDSFLEKFNDES
jgi:cell division protein FtsB